MPSSRFIFPIALCVSFTLPSLAQEAKKAAKPITLANVGEVGLLSETKHTARAIEHGPGSNELLFYSRTGLTVVGDKDFKLLRRIEKEQTRGFSLSQDRSLTSWTQGKKTIIRDNKTGKTMEIDSGERPGKAVFSPDGKVVAIGDMIITGSEGEGHSLLRIFDVKSGELIEKLEISTKGYGALSPVFSPDGKILAVGNRNYETKLFATDTWKLRHTLPKRMTYEIAFHPNGKTLAAGYADGYLGLWDVQSGKALHLVESGSARIHSVAWNSTGDLLATCSPIGGKHGPNNTLISKPGKVQLWDAKRCKVAKELMDVRWAGSVRFTRDNTRLMSVVMKKRTLDDGMRIAVWSTNAPAIAKAPKPKINVPTLPAKQSIALPPMAAPTIAVSPNGKRVAAPLNIKDELAMWDLTTGERKFIFQGAHDWQIWRMAFSPNGTTIATASLDKTAKLWSAQTGHLQATLKGHTDRLKYITYSPSGKYILTSTGKQWPYTPKGPVSARTWHAQTGKQIAEFRTHMDTIRSAVFSQDEKHVLTSSDDHTARLWEVTSGNELHTFDHKSRIITIDFSPNGKTILTSSSERRSPYMKGIRQPAEPSMKLWDAQTGKLLMHKPHQQGVTAAFNESGDQIITACRGVITYWDIASDKQLTTLREPLIGTDVVFSPNGKHFVVITPEEPMQLWSLSGQKQIALMMLDKPFRSFFSRDSRTFYSLTRAGGLRSWSIDDESGG